MPAARSPGCSSSACVPVVNENDAIADDEIRFGDNDRLAALVAHLVGADLLVLLTDTPGLLTADPRLDASASLIEEIVEFDHELEARAGGAGSMRGSGGMASKVAAAKMAAWSGVRTVIAAADRADVLADAVAGRPGVGTSVHPRPHRLGARKLWIAFAVGSSRHGRRSTTEPAGRSSSVSVSLLPAGVVGVTGAFAADDGGGGGRSRRRGVRQGPGPHRRRSSSASVAGRRTADLARGHLRPRSSTATTSSSLP